MGLGRKGVESALLRLTRLLQETIRNGKQKANIRPINSMVPKGPKGFSSVVAINTVKRR
jgi:hypothetical protein